MSNKVNADTIYSGKAREVDFDFALRGSFESGKILILDCEAPYVVPMESRIGFQFRQYGLYIGIPGRDGKWNKLTNAFDEPYYQNQYEIPRSKVTPAEAELLKQCENACMVCMEFLDKESKYRISLVTLADFACGKKLWTRDVRNSAQHNVLLNRIFKSIGIEGDHCAVRYNSETFALECSLGEPIICSDVWGNWQWSEQGQYLTTVPAVARGLTTTLVSGGLITGATCAAAGAGMFTTVTPGILWGSYTTVMSVGSVLSGAALPIAIGAAAAGAAAYCYKRAELLKGKGGSDERLQIFSHSEIEKATSGLSDKLIIGRGGLGPVYRGQLLGRSVAIKLLKPDASSSQGAAELTREIEVLSRFRHGRLVPLLGYCLSDRSPRLSCLVYPLLHASLGDALLRLRGPDPPQDAFHARVLQAPARLRIAAGVAAGLEYLHREAGYLHRDVKSANVLLDEEARAALSDVGLARPVEGGARGEVSRCGAGTFGYIDPEYEDSDEYRPSSDVFSLGVVLLELLTGLPASDRAARPPKLHRRVAGRLPAQAGQLADPRVEWPPAALAALAALAAACVGDVGDERPTAQELRAQIDAAELPAESHPPPAALSPAVAPPALAAAPAALAAAPPAEGGECLVCMAAPRRIRLRPCWHAVLCRGCLDGLRARGGACPCCQAAVEAWDEGDFPATFCPAPGPAAEAEAEEGERARA